MTIACTTQSRWRKALTLVVALAGASLTACAAGSDDDVAQTADGLKGGVPNSPKGKGKTQASGAAGAQAHGHMNQAGAAADSGHGKSDQDHGQAAAAGSASPGQGKGKSTTTKGNASADHAKGGAAQGNMGDKGGKSQGSDDDESMDESATP